MPPIKFSYSDGVAGKQMMDGMAGMGWGMSLVSLLVLILLVLGIGALVKYLVSSKK